MLHGVQVRVLLPAPRRSEIRSTPFQGGPFWGRLKTAFRSFAPPFQIEPASLGFDLGAISKKIDFIHLLHDKMTDYTKGVVCHLLLEHTQPITPQ